MKCSHCPHNIKNNDFKLSWKDWERLWTVQKWELTHVQSMQELSFIANMHCRRGCLRWCNYFRWSPDIFQASSFQLENLLRWSRVILHLYLQPQYHMNFIYISHHFTAQEDMNSTIDLARNVWLHSSVGRASHRYRKGHGLESRWSPDILQLSRASHRYRGGHRFESRWSPDIFQASSFQLLKLKIYGDDHSSLSNNKRNRKDELRDLNSLRP